SATSPAEYWPGLHLMPIPFLRRRRRRRPAEPTARPRSTDRGAPTTEHPQRSTRTKDSGRRDTMTTPPATTIPTATGEAPAALSPGDELDVLVVGAGGAGLSAAVFAAIAGLRTAVIERTDQVGGTTAFT